MFPLTVNRLPASARQSGKTKVTANERNQGGKLLKLQSYFKYFRFIKEWWRIGPESPQCTLLTNKKVLTCLITFGFSSLALQERTESSWNMINALVILVTIK